MPHVQGNRFRVHAEESQVMSDQAYNSDLERRFGFSPNTTILSESANVALRSVSLITATLTDALMNLNNSTAAALDGVGPNTSIDDMQYFFNKQFELLRDGVPFTIVGSGTNQITLVVGATTQQFTINNVQRAVTADRFTTPRTIAGVSFDGSANINIPYANLTGLPTIPSNNNQLANGLGFVNQTQVNASTVNRAHGLATARTINGVLFDGTSNITIPASSLGLPAWSLQTGANATVNIPRATATNDGGVRLRFANGTLFMTNNGTNP